MLEQNAVFHVYTPSCGRWENVFAPFNRFVKFTTHLEVSGKVSIAGAAAAFAVTGTARRPNFYRFRVPQKHRPATSKAVVKAAVTLERFS